MKVNCQIALRLAVMVFIVYASGTTLTALSRVPVEHNLFWLLICGAVGWLMTPWILKPLIGNRK